MIDYITLGAWVQDQLTSLTTDYNFAIQTQLGEYQFQPRQGKIYRKNRPIVSGTLISRPTELVPIKNYDVKNLTALLTLVVPEPMANNIYSIITAFVEENIGETKQIGEENNTTQIQFNFDTPTMGSMESRPGAGSSVEIRLFMYMLVYDDSVSSNAIHILLDDEELLVLQGAISNTSTLETSNISNDEHGLSVRQMQQIVFNGKFAYRNTTKLVALVKDIFEGTLEKTYTFKYYDGVAYTSTSPATINVLSSQISLNFTKGAIASIDVNMTEAHTETSNLPIIPIDDPIIIPLP